tara:strand:+ start:326 stop:511 length:186 start_codon:yes stop_codon:yes gene_type:complete
MTVKTFVYDSLMDLMEKAASLGWEDTYPDGTDDDYDEYVADEIEFDCINVLLYNGYEVVGP